MPHDVVTAMWFPYAAPFYVARIAEMRPALIVLATGDFSIGFSPGFRCPKRSDDPVPVRSIE